MKAHWPKSLSAGRPRNRYGISASPPPPPPRSHHRALAWSLSCAGHQQWCQDLRVPVWKGGNNNELQLLSNCYRNCFNIVQERSFRSIAFPSISTGVYGFPFEKACRIALDQTKLFLNNSSEKEGFEKVWMVCFSEPDFNVYLNIFREIFHKKR